MTTLGVRVRGLVFGFALAAPAVSAGCAKDPTELVVTATIDAVPARGITSFAVTLQDGQGQEASQLFASLDSVAADADVALFTFPAKLVFLIGSSPISGAVNVSVVGSDPLTAPTVLASGSGMAVVEHNKTTTTSVALIAAVLPTSTPDGGDAGSDDGGAPDADSDAAPATP